MNTSKCMHQHIVLTNTNIITFNYKGCLKIESVLYRLTWCSAWRPPQLLAQMLSVPGGLLLPPVQQSEPGSAHGRWLSWVRRRGVCQLWIHPEASVLPGGSLESGCCTGAVLLGQTPLQGENTHELLKALMGEHVTETQK